MSRMGAWLLAICFFASGAAYAGTACPNFFIAGKAPVPLQMYIQAVQRQSIANLHVTQDDLVRAFAHMVIPRETLAQQHGVIGQHNAERIAHAGGTLLL